jgi:hypothetical protein
MILPVFVPKAQLPVVQPISKLPGEYFSETISRIRLPSGVGNSWACREVRELEKKIEMKMSGRKFKGNTGLEFAMILNF